MQKRPQLSVLRKIPDGFYEMREHVKTIFFRNVVQQKLR